jgi:3-oxo-5-alpha-steroid 4-dehydrogenase 1
LLVSHATYERLVLVMLGLAVVTFVALRFVVAPYGRHTRGGWGPTLPDRVGWALMESPSLLWFSWLYWHGAHRMLAAPLALYVMWTIHYGHRTIVYPLRLKSRGKRMPVLIVAMAIAFNLLNSTVNASYISELGDYPQGWLASGRFILGAMAFAVGMLVNLDADRRLFALRKPGETGYRIPRGGLYELVSSPNYLGEIVEWAGWAAASWSGAGAAFLVYTIANLAPRASANHAWYRETFSDYPPKRRALLPFLW